MKSSRAFYIRSRPGRAGILLALAALTALAAGASLCLGAVSLPLRDTLRALLGGGEGTLASQIVLYARLPRVCGSLLAGGALAASGVVIQSVLMNPLAAPNIIGVNSGAGLAAAL